MRNFLGVDIGFVNVKLSLIDEAAGLFDLTPKK